MSALRPRTEPRPEVAGIPDADPVALLRVSEGIDLLESAGYELWPAKIVHAVREDRFDMAEPGLRVVEVVTGTPSTLGHAHDVFFGFCEPVEPYPPHWSDLDVGHYPVHELTRIWTDAANVALLTGACHAVG